MSSFDELAHAAVVDRVRLRIGDKRVLALIKAFLTAGVMSADGKVRDFAAGTPQGGSALETAAEQDTSVSVAVLWAAIERVAGREKVAGAVAAVTKLVPDDSGGADSALRLALAQRYRTVLRLPDLAARKVTVKPLQLSDIDSAVVPLMWQWAVFGNPALPSGAMDRDASEVCVLEQLFKALRIRDVFAWPSLRWGDPRAALLEGPA